MSGFRKFQNQAKGQEVAENERNPLHCYANGCPLFGSTSLGGGRFMCMAHAWATSDDWGRITRQLNEHQWLIDLIADLNRCKSDTEWVSLATKFWTDYDDELIPTESERTRKGNYMTRMHYELMYRIGVKQKRMQPIEPKQIKARSVAGFARA